MELMCIVVTIGTVIQTASVNIGMFLAGRVLAGYAVGGVVACLYYVCFFFFFFFFASIGSVLHYSF